MAAPRGRRAAPIKTSENLMAASTQRSSSDTADPSTQRRLEQLSVELISQSRHQARTEFDPAELDELVQSIKEQGLLQPITVRELAPDAYELVAGERRLRATVLAGLSVIDAIVIPFTDSDAVTNELNHSLLGLIENVQRSNLNAVDEARAYQRLINEFNLTQGEAAKAVGKSRSTVTNLMRLLDLQPPVLLMLERGDLTPGHARALLSIDDRDFQVSAAKTVVERQLSVRQVEALVAEYKKRLENLTFIPESVRPEAEMMMERDLQTALGLNVNCTFNDKGKGRVVIQLNSQADYDALLKKLKLAE